MFGPLFGKELLETARRRRYYWLRAVAVGLLYLTFSNTIPNIPQTFTAADSAFLGQRFFQAFQQDSLLILLLVPPIVTAGLVAGERERRSFETLLTTSLTNWEIILGKLASRWLMLLMILLLNLPVVAFFSLFGGFGLPDVLTLFVVQTIVLMTSSSFTIYCSVISSKPYLALIKAYVGLLLWWVVLPVGVEALEKLRGHFPLLDAVKFITPMSIIDVVDQLLLGQWRSGAIFAGANLGLTMLMLWRSCRQLRREQLSGRTAFLFDFLTGGFRRLVGGLQRLLSGRQHRFGWQRLSRWEELSRHWFMPSTRQMDNNPMLLRNVTANVYDPDRFITAAQWMGWILVYGWVHVLVRAGGITNEAATRMLSVQALMLLVLLIILAACSIVREKSQQSWEMLLLTPLTAQQFISGTLWGIVRVVRPSIVLFLLSCLLLSVESSHPLATIWAWVLLVVMAAAALMLVGLLFSLTCQRQLTALLFTFATPVLTLLVWESSFLLLLERNVRREYALLWHGLESNNPQDVALHRWLLSVYAGVVAVVCLIVVVLYRYRRRYRIRPIGAVFALLIVAIVNIPLFVRAVRSTIELLVSQDLEQLIPYSWSNSYLYCPMKPIVIGRKQWPPFSYYHLNIVTSQILLAIALAIFAGIAWKLVCIKFDWFTDRTLVKTTHKAAGGAGPTGKCLPPPCTHAVRRSTRRRLP